MLLKYLYFTCIFFLISAKVLGQHISDSLINQLEPVYVHIDSTISVGMDSTTNAIAVGFDSTTNDVNELIEFLKSTWGTLNFWIIFLILGINMIIGIVQLFVPFGQNRREKKLIEHRLKISKKHEYIERIHIHMCNTYNSLLFSDINIRIKELTDLKIHSGLYIDDSLKSIIESFIESAERGDGDKCLQALMNFESRYKN